MQNMSVLSLAMGIRLTALAAGMDEGTKPTAFGRASSGYATAVADFADSTQCFFKGGMSSWLETRAVSGGRAFRPDTFSSSGGLATSASRELAAQEADCASFGGDACASIA